MACYENGTKSYTINEDGTGFAYYPNKKTAFCSSQASAYQNSFYAFDNDKKNTLLLAIDEHGIGFCNSSRSEDADTNGISMVFTALGAVITDEKGDIVYDWKWDRESMNAGTAPSTEIVCQINGSLKFRFQDSKRMNVDFHCENINHSFDVGVKQKRNTNYLSNATRQPGGRLLPQIENVTLKDRQNVFEKSMRAQRNKLHPRSENLSDMVKTIVGKLENDFEGLDKRMCATTCIEASWKNDALSNTIREIPRIPLSGAETGVTSGFGTQIYGSKEDVSMAKTLPMDMLNSNGSWKNELDIRTTLMGINPPLKRSATLRAASGRYSSMLVVNPALVTASNPTGMIVPIGLPLEPLHWSKLKSLISSKGGTDGANTLIVALIMRTGDPICCESERIAELVHRQLDDEKQAGEASTSSTNGSVSRKMEYTMARIDVGQDSTIIKELGIKALPTVVMFHQGAMVYAGPMGGRKVKAMDCTPKPQILLLEPNFRNQIMAEKTLRKIGCDTFLCLSVQAAIERVHQFCNSSEEFGPAVLFDAILVSDDVSSGDITALSKKCEEHTRTNRTIIAIMVNVLGENGSGNLRAVKWKDASTDEVSKVVPAPLCAIAQIAIQKPIKPASITTVLDRRNFVAEDIHMGLTTESLLGKMKAVAADIFLKGPKSHNPNPYVGIRLSAEDVKMQGRDLTNQMKPRFPPPRL